MYEKTAKSLSRKSIDNLYSDSFEDMEPRTVYSDPLGTKTSKGAFSLKPKFYENDKEWFKNFNEVQKQYNPPSLQKAIELTNESIESKAVTDLNTGKWNIPIYYLPDVYVTDPEKTPMADLIARETVNSDTINVTRQEKTPSLQSPLENNDYSEVDYDSTDYFPESQFDIYGYGLKSQISDKMLLASRSLRSPENEAEKLHTKAIREFEEAQILYGTQDYSGGYTKNNTSSFDGFNDLGTTYASTDPGSLTAKTATRELIDEVEFQGGDRSSTAVVTNFDTHRKLRNALDDFVRYEIGGDELGFGFPTMEFDGVPIFKSHAIPNTPESGQPYLFAVDLGSHGMGMLQDMTAKPLAKTKPQEQYAMDAYGALYSQAPSHIQYIEKT